MKKKIYVFAALALALVICAAAGLQPAVCACAAYSVTDPAEPDPTNPVDPEPEDFAYDDVYFFTNRSNASAAGSKMYLELVLRYYGAFDFHFQIYDLFNQWGLSWSSLSVPVNDNSVVIFEISGINSMCFQYNDASGVLLSGLNDGLVSLFSGWKNDGCRIILLNDTEELRLLDENLDYDTSPYTEFLDFVDVHINTDFFTLFVDTILRESFEGGPVSNFVFLLDVSLATDLDAFLSSSFMFVEYIYRYIIMTDAFELRRFGNLQHYFEANNVSFVFYDPSSDSLLEVYNFLIDCGMNQERICAIGSNGNGNPLAEQWLFDMVMLREMTALNFEIYQFCIGEVSRGIWFYNDRIKLAWSVDAVYLEDFWNIFDAVARDGDLSDFNNWYGRCDVTYKPFVGEGGWMSIINSFYYLLDEEWLNCILAD